MKGNYNPKHRNRWEKQMCHYLKICSEKAHNMAQNKIDFNERCIEQLEKYQKRSFCWERANQITFLKNRNIFNDICCLYDAQIAFALNFKHQCTNYDKYLLEAHKKVRMGTLPYGEARNYASEMMFQELKERKML